MEKKRKRERKLTSQELENFEDRRDSVMQPILGAEIGIDSGADLTPEQRRILYADFMACPKSLKIQKFGFDSSAKFAEEYDISQFELWRWKQGKDWEVLYKQAFKRWMLEIGETMADGMLESAKDGSQGRNWARLTFPEIEKENKIEIAIGNMNISTLNERIAELEKALENR